MLISTIGAFVLDFRDFGGANRIGVDKGEDHDSLPKRGKDFGALEWRCGFKCWSAMLSLSKRVGIATRQHTTGGAAHCRSLGCSSPVEGEVSEAFGWFDRKHRGGEGLYAVPHTSLVGRQC